MIDDWFTGSGTVFVGLAVGSLLLAMAYKSPLLRWCTTVAVLLVWLALGVLLPAACVWVHVGRGAYALAVMCVITAVLVGLAWRALGWPVLRRAWALRSVYWKAWE